MKQEKKAVCTIAMIVINITIFLVLSFQGMTEDGIFMFHHGAMYVPSVLEEGEYYRLFTSMFLHFGFEHLMNNMFILGVIGWNLELEIGKWKYLAVYLLSGLMGNLLSAWMDIQTGEYAISAGASGAIFGVIGALFYVALRNRGRIGNISSRGLAFMVLCSLYLGFTSKGVDNSAHIGGVISGILLAAILYHKKKYPNGRDSQLKEEAKL